jgi:D-alanine-D-alanine ligase
MKALDKNKYTIVPIMIDQTGSWQGTSIQGDPKGNPDLDVVFPVLHGTYGEDGTMQGLLELANLPYVGPGVASSAVAMDKAFMRILFKDAGLPLLPWDSIFHYEWKEGAQGIKDRLESSLGYPMFVKPANLGSSVGISKVKSAAELGPALNLAFSYDRKVVVEQGLIGGREVECSVLGHNDPQASVAGEVIPAHEFYDYGAKYHNDESRLIIPAPLDDKQAKCIGEYAIRAFKAVDCSGMGRVDFFLDQRGEIYINEINTIPGFTQISMYPKLWENSGLPYANLLDRLIEIALEKHQERQALRTSIS